MRGYVSLLEIYSKIGLPSIRGTGSINFPTTGGGMRMGFGATILSPDTKLDASDALEKPLKPLWRMTACKSVLNKWLILFTFRAKIK